MEVNRYGRRLAELRSNYEDASTELKENYDKGLKTQGELHEAQEKNQYKNYLNAKNGIEDSTEATLERYDQALKNELSKRTERYRDKLDDKNRNFDFDRRSMQRNYNSKLDRISRSFDTASKEKDKIHEMHKMKKEVEYKDGLVAREKDFNQKMRGVNITAVDSLNELRGQQYAEKNNLISRQASEKQELVQAANVAKNKANNINQLEKETLRNGFAQQTRSQRNNSENQLSALRVTQNQEREGMRETFKELTDKIGDRNVEALQRINKESKEDKRQLEKRFSNDRISLERQANKLLNEGKSKSTEHTKERRLINNNEKRVKSLRNKAADENYRNQLLTKRIATENQNNLKNLEVTHSQDLLGKETAMRTLREDAIGGLKERFEEQAEESQYRMKRLERDKSEQEVSSRKTLKNEVDRQRLEFGRQLNKTNEKNIDLVNDIKSDFVKEKSKFIEQTKKDVFRDRESLKDEMRAGFTRKEESLNKRIEQQTDINKRTVDQYEERLVTHRKKAAKEIEHIKVLENDRRLEDKRLTKLEVDGYRKEFANSVGAIKADFDKKLSRTKAQNDIHVTKLTRRYEEILGRERQGNAKELQRKTNLLKGDFMRLAQQSQLEKEGLINQYEIKIDKMRETNRMTRELNKERQVRGDS
jgi:hypothetical protein